VSSDELAWALAEAARSEALVSQDIASMTPYSPGRPWRAVAAELGVPADELLMLHANENPLGPSPKAKAAAARHLEEAHVYPDGGGTLLREKLAERHQVPVESICLGNGSNELIEMLVRTFVGHGETVVTAWPSFVVYRLAAQAAGREVLFAPLRNERYDLATMASLVDRRTKLVFIANPNNPTGTYVTKRQLAAFLDRIPRSVIVVLDEAYFEYAVADDYPNGLVDFRGHPRLVVLRTFSKIYGLAGLRIGYGVMDPTMVHYLDCVRQPYNVNSVAQAAAVAALDDEDHLRTSVQTVRDGLAELEKGLGALGLQVVPSQANFLLVRLEREAAPIVSQLRAKGILVRDMRGYDLPTTIRLTVGTRAMNLRVLSAIEQALEDSL
jgi:histidinol-phosphate aminotransferase